METINDVFRRYGILARYDRSPEIISRIDESAQDRLVRMEKELGIEPEPEPEPEAKILKVSGNAKDENQVCIAEPGGSV